jgi:hypothetical protein
MCEEPEECPCGAANADDDGEPIYDGDPAFCSKACVDKYIVRMREEAEAEYQDYCDSLRDLREGR